MENWKIYSCCTAALGGSYADLSHAERQPFFSPASLSQLQAGLGVGTAVEHKNSGGCQMPMENGSTQILAPSSDAQALDLPTVALLALFPVSAVHELLPDHDNTMGFNRESPRTQHRHGITTRLGEHFPTFDQIIDGTIHFCKGFVS